VSPTPPTRDDATLSPDSTTGGDKGDTDAEVDALAVSVPLAGVDVDAETRCAHYHTDRDIVAMRVACCDRYYPCVECHEAVVGDDHELVRVPPAAFDEPAVVCGVCGTRLTVTEYVAVLSDASTGAGVDDPRCPDCGAGFNPGCRDHLDRYFAVDRATPPPGVSEESAATHD
jgi:uncharacterized CHY-type Zn-finger protein